MKNETMENQEMTLVESKTIFDYLPFAPTMEQKKALYEISEFVDESNTDNFYILSGAAGTGKTSILKAVVDYLVSEETGLYLCAPSNQAAKVLGQKTNHLSSTIQKVIYRTSMSPTGQVIFSKKENSLKGFTVYLVDEASMVSDDTRNDALFSSPNGVLTDLIDFILSGNAKNKVIFIGDQYQLPPVNETIKALDAKYLEKTFGLTGSKTSMTEVKRQTEGSPVLTLATEIRKRKDIGVPLTGLTMFTFRNFTGILTRFLNLFSIENPANVVFIAYKNRDVDFFNKAVRKQLGRTLELEVQDYVILENNLLHENQLISKGERGIVIEVGSKERKAELDFCEATIEFKNSEGNPILVRRKVLLNWLNKDVSDPMSSEIKNLAHERKAQNPKYRESDRIWDDEFLSSLRLRYAYAITCHKAQGSEWNHVLIHPWYNADDHAFLYTAVTRAKTSLATYSN
jgi:exodeoxyribonuclease-5